VNARGKSWAEEEKVVGQGRKKADTSRSSRLGQWEEKVKPQIKKQGAESDKGCPWVEGETTRHITAGNFRKT